MARTFLFLFALLAAGCAPEASDGKPERITQNAFSQVTAGMSLDDVVAILGEPTEKMLDDGPDVESRQEIYRWKRLDSEASAIVTFLNGEVVVTTSVGLNSARK